MCRICSVEAAMKMYAWPVPVRPHVTAFLDNIGAARDACHAYRAAATRAQGEAEAALKADAVQKVKVLSSHLKQIAVAQETWWASRREMRLQLREDIENERKTQNFKAATQGERARQAQKTAQQKFNELQAINSRAMHMISDVHCGLDILHRTTLGMNPDELGSD